MHFTEVHWQGNIRLRCAQKLSKHLRDEHRCVLLSTRDPCCFRMCSCMSMLTPERRILTWVGNNTRTLGDNHEIIVRNFEIKREDPLFNQHQKFKKTRVDGSIIHPFWQLFKTQIQDIKQIILLLRRSCLKRSRQSISSWRDLEMSPALVHR